MIRRSADVAAANEVTRRGRDTLGLICRELAVAEVAALLPPLVHLEFECRYAAMLSHEPKNYALLTYDDRLLLRGVAFRSSRSEPFGDTFLRRAVRCLLEDDIVGVREAWLETVFALRRGTLSTYDVSSRVRLTKTPDEYAAVRPSRRELPYEAMLASGRRHGAWANGCGFTGARRESAASCRNKTRRTERKRQGPTPVTMTWTITCASCATRSRRGSSVPSIRKDGRLSSPIPSNRLARFLVAMPIKYLAGIRNRSGSPAGFTAWPSLRMC